MVSAWLAVVANVARSRERTVSQALIRQTKQTADEQLRANEAKSRAEKAEVAEASGRYFVATQRARQQLAIHSPGWKNRVRTEIAEAHRVSTFRESASHELANLAISASSGLDVSKPIFKVDIKSGRFMAFHPTKPILLVATSRAYIPDIQCHVYLLDSQSGDALRDIGLPRSFRSSSKWHKECRHKRRWATSVCCHEI